MQSSNEDKKDAAPPDAELSATWQALLGLEMKTTKVDPATTVQPLASDPWSSLLNACGMQPVDLQKVHLHNLRTLANDDSDIEHALDIMREATGQLPSVKEPSKEA